MAFKMSRFLRSAEKGVIRESPSTGEQPVKEYDLLFSGSFATAATYGWNWYNNTRNAYYLREVVKRLDKVQGEISGDASNWNETLKTCVEKIDKMDEQTTEHTKILTNSVNNCNEELNAIRSILEKRGTWSSIFFGLGRN